MSDEKKERQYPLNAIYFYLTKGCNLRCCHCWIEPSAQSNNSVSLSLDLFKSIIDQAKPLGLSSLKLTGGEPLLHPQISEILDFIKIEELSLNVETNGVLCTKELAKKIVLCKNSFVSVSIDAASASIHDQIRGVGGSFEGAKQGVRNLVEAGLSPQIILSILPANKDQLEPVVRLAESLGAGSVKFNIVQPTSRGKVLHQKGEVLSIEELIRLGEWVENTLSKQTHLSLIYSHPAAFKPLHKIFTKPGLDCRSCGILGILGVLADGSYALCGIGEAISKLVFGHAEKKSLQDVWDNASILEEIRAGLYSRFEGVCSECLLRSKCLGGCIAQNYALRKNLWSSFWYCDQADKKGLFPETRKSTMKKEEVYEISL